MTETSSSIRLSGTASLNEAVPCLTASILL
jgi:hypothetical protein